MKNQKTRRAGRISWEDEANNKGQIVTKNHTTVDSRCQTDSPTKKILTHVDILMLQAEERMESDLAGYGSHFLIWLSLYSLKFGLGVSHE